MKYKLSFSTGPPTYIMKFSFNSGIKSNVEYGDFLFKIKPTVPNLFFSAISTTDRLKFKSIFKVGSAYKIFPFFNLIVVCLVFYIH